MEGSRRVSFDSPLGILLLKESPLMDPCLFVSRNPAAPKKRRLRKLRETADATAAPLVVDEPQHAAAPPAGESREEEDDDDVNEVPPPGQTTLPPVVQMATEEEMAANTARASTRPDEEEEEIEEILMEPPLEREAPTQKIGRASCRERVCQYV